MKTYLVTVFLLLSGILLSQPTQKQGVLSGKVVNNNGEPAEMATVFIHGTNLHAYTDEKGDFRIENVPLGKEYEVEIKEFNNKGVVVKVDLRHKSETIVVRLKSDGNIDLSEVIVVGKNSGMVAQEKGYAMDVVSTQAVALQSIQVNELLSRSAGVIIRQDGGLGSHIHYNINGMTGNAVKIFIDGIPIANYGPSFSLNSIPAALIERIDVFKGVVPIHLSDDALGGAISVILKQQAQKTLTTSYSYGSFNTHQWNLNGNYIDKNGFTVQGSAFYNYSDNNYKVWGRDVEFKDYTGAIYPNQTAKRFNDAYESYGIRMNTGFIKTQWADRFLVGGIFSKDYKEQQHGTTMKRVYGDRHNRRNANVMTLLYDKKDFIFDRLSLKVDANYSHLKRQVIDTVGIMHDWQGPILYPDGTPVRYSSGAEVGSQKTAQINTDKTFVTRVNLGYQINKNNTIFANYFVNDFERGVSDDFLHPMLQRLRNTKDLNKSIFSFSYENMAFSKKMKTSIFLKHYIQKSVSNDPYRVSADVYSVEITRNKMEHTGYGMVLSYALLPKLIVLGSGEKTIRMPGPDELFGNLNDNLLPPVNDHLDPEQSYNANIGVNLGPYEIANGHSVKINTSVFYRNTRGMIREAIIGGSFDYSRYENLENVLTQGIDAEILYNYKDKIDFTFNISKINSLFNTEFNEQGAPYLFYKTQIRNEPSFKFNANLAYHHKDLFIKNTKATFYYNVHYVEEFLRNWANVGRRNLDIIPTQFANNLGASYTLPSNKITISFDAKNIFNRQIFDNFGLQKPGRAFYGKLTYTIL